MYLMMSEGAAKLWFNGLPEKSINSWDELKALFQGHVLEVVHYRRFRTVLPEERRVSASLDAPGHSHHSLIKGNYTSCGRVVDGENLQI
jgi:hypothetical protein